ncbi:MAG: helix-turn-helix transcriptional regulator [Alphaproteobacteria bacterium]
MELNAYNRLVSTLYDALLDNANWPKSLKAIADSFDSAGIYFHVLNSTTKQVLGGGSYNVDETGLHEYVTEMVKYCPRVAHYERTKATGLLYDGLHISEDEMKRDPFYNWILRYGLKYYLAIQLTPGADIVAAVSIQRTPKQGHATRDHLRLAALIEPHLHRIFRVQQFLEGADLRAGLAENALNRLRIGVVFVDSNGRVLHASRPAERILAGGDGLVIFDGRMVAAHPDDDRAFQHALGHAVAPWSVAAGATISLRRPSMRRPIQALICPVARPATVLGLLRPTALIFLVDPEQLPQHTAATLARLHGLTPAEAAMAADLLAGLSLKDHAERRSITLNTARWRMKQVLAKTGTQSQAELMRALMGGLAGAVDPENHP